MRIEISLKKILLLFIPVLILSCAKQAPLTGGPQDTEPPKMVEAKPPIGTTNFSEKIIQVKFDEYIKLNNVSQKLIISPPISPKPNVVVSGKGFRISLNQDLLLPNTTYSFNFNDAIADNNENNALNSFVYAFSTGDIIDSLNISGKVLDSFTKKPVEDIWILLYDRLEDSAFYSTTPTYISRTNKAGDFLLPYIKENDYKIYALKDMNSNNMYDLPNESIAFIDSIIRPQIEYIIHTDSLPSDTLSINNKLNSYIYTPDNIELLLFTENKQSQFIKSHKRLKSNYLEIEFNTIQYEDYDIIVDEDPNAIIYAKNNPDTVKIWLYNENLIASDSLKIFMKYKDPIYQDTIHYDTLKFRRPDKAVKDTSIKIKINPGNMPYQYFSIETEVPILSFDNSKLKIEQQVDSTFKEINFILEKDSINPLKIMAMAEIEENSTYKFSIDSSFITFITNFSNKLDSVTVKTASEGDFGGLSINFNDKSLSYVIQLIQNDKTIRELATENGNTLFNYLTPGLYTIRVIEDINNNKRWDTGDFEKKIQPEPVYYYPSEYEIKSKWTHEIQWEPKTNISKE